MQSLTEGYDDWATTLDTALEPLGTLDNKQRQYDNLLVVLSTARADLEKCVQRLGGTPPSVSATKTLRLPSPRRFKSLISSRITAQH